MVLSLGSFLMVSHSCSQSTTMTTSVPYSPLINPCVIMFVYCQVLNNALACHNKWRNRMGTVLSCFLVCLFSSFSTSGLDGRLRGAPPGRDGWLPDVEIMTDHWWDITGCGEVTCETAGHDEHICNALIGFSWSSGSQKSIENDCQNCSNSAYLVLPSQKIPTSPPQWKGVCICVDVHSDSDALIHWSGYPMWLCMLWSLLSLCFFSSIRISSTYLSLTSPPRSTLLLEGGIHRFCSPITSDFYLHRSVLLRWLRSSPYSSFPSPSHLFYDDMSFWLGQVLLGPCAFFLSI